MLVPIYLSALANFLGARHLHCVKHHYLPQSLLRRCINAAGELRVFGIQNGWLMSSERAPQSTGYEDGLYAVIANALGFGDSDIIEKKLFDPVDNNAAKVLKSLAAR